MTVSPENLRVAHDWLQTPLGASLLRQEVRIIEEACDGIFGEHCLQLGTWGESREFLRFARTQRTSLIAEAAQNGDTPATPSAIGHLHRLPRASDSIDAVRVPHTREDSDRPHASLRGPARANSSTPFR